MRPALATAPNFRDLGGLPTIDGRRVRSGLVFRSEALLAPTAEDAAAIAAHGIVLVCDLRSDTERGHAPNDWWAARGVERLHLDILAGIRTPNGPWSRLKADPTIDGALAAMDGIYAAMPAAALAHVAAIVARIAAGDLPLLIHCTAGKDRTGFVSAMLLAALGTEHEAIVADYLDSEGRRTAQVREGTRRMVIDRVGEGVPAAAIDALMGVDRRYIEASFAVVEARYGGVAGYLVAGGVDRRLLDAVRERLVG